MSVLRTTAKELHVLAEKYLSERTAEPKCVHRTLLLRSLVILKKLHPETEDFFAPMMKTLMPYAKRPDRKGDYENGMGRRRGRAASQRRLAPDAARRDSRPKKEFPAPRRGARRNRPFRRS